MQTRHRKVIPSMLFAGLLGHIFVSVPLLLYVLSTIDGRIVFYVLFFSFQLYVCTLVCLALFVGEDAISPLFFRLLRLFSVFCWGGICFLVYAMIGSIVYSRIQRDAPYPKAPAITVAWTSERPEGNPSHGKTLALPEIAAGSAVRPVDFIC